MSRPHRAPDHRPSPGDVPVPHPAAIRRLYDTALSRTRRAGDRPFARYVSVLIPAS